MLAGQMDQDTAGSITAEPVQLEADARWQLIQRIAESGSFQKSSRLPALLRYLARCTILGDRQGLSEQSIGRAVFNKRQDYTPTEDSSVRVYIRQLRIRLREFYLSEAQAETVVVDVPKGGYALSFTPVQQVSVDRPELTTAEPVPLPNTPKQNRTKRLPFFLIPALTLAFLVCAAGWLFTATRQNRPELTWPLNLVVSERSQTTVVLADVGYSLRLLGDKQVALDRYIDRSYLKDVIPEHMDKGEARLIHYLAASHITSIADANAAATISVLASPYTRNLVIRSARDLNSSDLTRGNLIFVGARTSNPWVELYDDALDFQVVEDLASGGRFIRNRHPQPGEQATYAVPGSTGTSGEDFAILALIPNRSGNGSVLLLQGIRLEGTEAALKLLQNEDLSAELRRMLTAANHRQMPTYFQALIHARSIAGAPVSVEFVSARPIPK